MLDLGLVASPSSTAPNALLGLLCLKRSGAGFCSDEDVSSRDGPAALTGPVTLSVHPPN